MKKSIKSIFVLVCICAAVSVLLALVNYITVPIIKDNEHKKVTAALLEVLPDGGSFELVETSDHKLPSSVSEVYLAESGGYVIKLTVSGYSAGMVLMCGISPDGVVVGTKLIASGETPSIGGVAVDKFAPSLVGKDVSNIDGVDAIAGATKTTAAYRAAVKDALSAVIILGGGQIEAMAEDNCNGIDTITGVPVTADGYQKAILRAFETVKISQEGNQL